MQQTSDWPNVFTRSAWRQTTYIYKTHLVAPKTKIPKDTTRKCEKLPSAWIQVQGLLWTTEEGLHLLSKRGKKKTWTWTAEKFIEIRRTAATDPACPREPKKLLKHLHNPVDKFLVLLRNVCRAFGRGWGDEGRRPDTIGVLIPALFRLLPQLGFLFLVQVRDSSSGETNTTAFTYCAFVKDKRLVTSATVASGSAGWAEES